MNHIMRLAGIAALTVLVISSAAAQTPTGTVVGRVLDQQQAVVPKATVGLKSDTTNVERLTTSNEEGNYLFTLVSPGRYTVRVEAGGFQPAKYPIEVAVAASTRLDITLGLHELQQVVNVAGESGVAVQTENAMLGTTVNQNQIMELPSVSRNPYDFVAFAPGATDGRYARGIGFSVNGQRLESSSFLLDGSDNNNAYSTGPGQLVPLDAVQEYRLQTNNFTAEYGRTVGFIANVVTKSGSNNFHGGAYDFIRNSALSTNTFENNARGLQKPVFNRHQFGGTVGGPIKKDKAFFFFAIEPILVRSSGPVSGRVPTPQLLALSSPGTQEIFKRFPLPSNLSTTDVLTRTVCPFGSTCNSQTGAGLVTLPALAFVSAGRGPINAGAGQPQNTYLLTSRIDYSIDNKTTLSGRYAFQNTNQFPSVNQVYSPTLYQPVLSRNQNATLTLTRVWSPSFLTESRIVYNRIATLRPDVGPGLFPIFGVSADSVSLPRGSNPSGGPANTYQIYQSGDLTRGKHNLKFGGQFLQLRDNRTSDTSGFGRPSAPFFGVQGLVDGIIFRYAINVDAKGKVPGQVVSPPFSPAVGTRHFRYNDFAFFVQDSWKVSPRFTVSPGLRWEVFGVQHSPGQEQSLDSNFYYGDGSNIFERIANGSLLRTSDAPGEYHNRFYRPDYNNFGPRMGLAYDLTGNGKTVLRSGAGIFYDRIHGQPTFNMMLNPPAVGRLFFSNIPLTTTIFDDPLSVLPQVPAPFPASTVFRVNQDLRTSYTVAWNAGIEHEVGSKFVLGANYIGSSGSKLYMNNRDSRIGSGQFVGRPGTRLAQNLNDFVTYANLGHSSYHALQLRVDSRKIESIGLQFGTNYTWSHALDNLSSTNSDDYGASNDNGPLDAFNPGLDKASADQDIRHRFTANFIWQVPMARNSTGWSKRVLGGWEMTGILTFQTGQPSTLADDRVFDYQNESTRPRLTGVAPVPYSSNALVSSVNTPDNFLYLPINQVRNPDRSCVANATPFACEVSVNGPFDGTIGRNSFRQPGVHFENLALMKNFDLSRVREGVRLQFRAEVYNILNHPNLYLNPGSKDVGTSSFNAVGGSTPGVTANFGSPWNFPQDARQIVMALKVMF